MTTIEKDVHTSQGGDTKFASLEKNIVTIAGRRGRFGGKPHKTATLPQPSLPPPPIHTALSRVDHGMHTRLCAARSP